VLSAIPTFRIATFARVRELCQGFKHGRRKNEQTNFCTGMNSDSGYGGGDKDEGDNRENNNVN
jgi:hypothetical protein